MSKFLKNPSISYEQISKDMLKYIHTHCDGKKNYYLTEVEFIHKGPEENQETLE